MKFNSRIIAVLPVWVLLNACGTAPEAPSSQPKAPMVGSSDAAVQESADVKNADTATPVTTASNAQVPESTQPNPELAALEAQQKQLEAQKAELLAQKQEMEQQKASVKGPGDLKGAAFSNFMAKAEAAPAGANAGKLAKLAAAAAAANIADIIDAIKDLIADLVAALADVQAKLDAVAAKIAAAKAK